MTVTTLPTAHTRVNLARTLIREHQPSCRLCADARDEPIEDGDLTWSGPIVSQRIVSYSMLDLAPREHARVDVPIAWGTRDGAALTVECPCCGDRHVYAGEGIARCADPPPARLIYVREIGSTRDWLGLGERASR